MVPSDWDLAPQCIRGPNFIPYLIRESHFCRLRDLLPTVVRRTCSRGRDNNSRNNDGVEGTGTLPDYLVNRDDQKNEGPFGGKNCTEIEK